MHFTTFPFSAAVLATFFSTVNGANILMTNDDGFGTANIREMYKAMKAYGHNVFIVAPATDQSGKGGSLTSATTANLTEDTEFGLVKADAPSIGPDPLDDHIWYYDGSPVAATSVGTDYVLPKFGVSSPDLVMSGPNYGDNVGIPAIAFSAANGASESYKDLNASTSVGLKDPQIIAGKVLATFANDLIKKQKGERLLPLGYGINGNMPEITSATSNDCIDPPFIRTRMIDEAWTLGVTYGEATGLFTEYENASAPALDICINGDCDLPSETNLISTTCKTAVIIFSIDYDAPSCPFQYC
ncbi:sure-like protein [Penicillium malachiteum]|uniref:sure-like protein n=1 Tax=Penicillium malachiteum TaxID=1324776 RepID=UPI00254991B2|nr:sure-like protein [Penicillium malachiteum]KAJ5724985.1 sure-like protein [Penicillium malachiteum]